MKNLIIASTNKGKIKEFTEFFSEFPFNVIGQPEDLEIEETGTTFAENARLKAISAARFFGEIALADDSGLNVSALNGKPGIYSSRYASTDLERIRRLLKELEGCADRSAFFLTALCLASPSGEVLIEVEGICHGVISNKLRGKNGFGYDPIFEVCGTDLTYAEMDPNEKKTFRTSW